MVDISWPSFLSYIKNENNTAKTEKKTKRKEKEKRKKRSAEVEVLLGIEIGSSDTLGCIVTTPGHVE